MGPILLCLTGVSAAALGQLIGEEGFIAPGAESYVFDLRWGSQGGLNDEFSSPEGVAVDPSGNVWVADTSNDRITKFDASGNVLFNFGSVGSGPGQFSNPHGISVDVQGNIWVADTSNNRVQKLRGGGRFVWRCLRDRSVQSPGAKI